LGNRFCLALHSEFAIDVFEMVANGAGIVFEMLSDRFAVLTLNNAP